MATIEDIDIQALDALIERLQQAKTYELTLKPADIELLITALLTLSHLQDKLSDQDITVHKLRKLAGIISSSERLKDLLPANSIDDEKSEADQKSKEGDDNKTNRKKKPKPKKKPFTPVIPEQIYHPLSSDFSKGMRCPECEIGTLSKYEPAVMLRITGHSPYEVKRHIMERLRCNACGVYFTAPLSDEVKKDGTVNQRYGYSARSLMAINKYYMGQPFYRQATLQQILGVSITASTLFDQCEHVANAIKPVYDSLLLLAANAVAYEIDDTPYKILKEREAQKPNRKTGKLQRRTGTNASGLIATLAEGQLLILIKTDIGHAGEWIDEILKQRSSKLPPPLLMSDALSSNNPTVTPVIHSLCNAHARRKFAELIEHFPIGAEWVLKQYAAIWINETHCTDEKLTPAERQSYHQKNSLPVMNTMKKRFETELENESVEENSGLGKAMCYFLNRYTGLIQFCHKDNARLDNNRMEAELKIPIRNRKNAYFYQTQVGADISDILTSVISTCIHANVNPFDYLTWIQQNPIQVKASPDSCFPWNYQKNSQKIAA